MLPVFQVVGLKPLPKEPAEQLKKKKSMSNPFLKSKSFLDYCRNEIELF